MLLHLLLIQILILIASILYFLNQTLFTIDELKKLINKL